MLSVTVSPDASLILQMVSVAGQEHKRFNRTLFSYTKQDRMQIFVGILSFKATNNTTTTTKTGQLFSTTVSVVHVCTVTWCFFTTVSVVQLYTVTCCFSTTVSVVQVHTVTWCFSTTVSVVQVYTVNGLSVTGQWTPDFVVREIGLKENTFGWLERQVGYAQRLTISHSQLWTDWAKSWPS